MYTLVLWPESQIFMEHPLFRQKCYLMQGIFDEQEHHDSSYFVPVWLYKEVLGIEPEEE
jgi:hypothetical protein